MSVKHSIRIFFIFIIALVYTGSLTAQEKAYPKNGEGITLFLKRFNRTGGTYQKEFIELNKGKLGKNNSLRMGVKYTLPPLASAPQKKNYQPLFGKSLASYKVTSSDLKGACFYLVSGHGGPDPGAIGKMGSHELHEDEYAYDIMLRLARNLLTRGAKVHIIIQDAKDGIRDQQFLKINSLSRKDKETYKRAIFIHVDSRSRHQRTDVFFYHKPKDQASKRLAKTMKSTFSRKYNRHQPGRGFSGTVDDRNLYVLRHTTPTSVFVELGNIQNQYDQQRIILSNNRQALANWLCEGFVTDYNYCRK